MTLTADRALAQRRDALARANDTRTRRSRMKREIAAGRLSAAVLILDPPEWAHTMLVVDLVLAIPYVGRVKARRVLTDHRVSYDRTLGDLTDRQRLTLAAELTDRRVRTMGVRHA